MHDRPNHDAEAIQPVWPGAHKPSTADSILNGSFYNPASTTKNYNSAYEMHSQPFRQMTQESRESGWGGSDAHGGEKHENVKHVVQMQQADTENPEQTFRNSVEMGRLQAKTFGVNVEQARG